MFASGDGASVAGIYLADRKLGITQNLPDNLQRQIIVEVLFDSWFGNSVLVFSKSKADSILVIYIPYSL